MPNYNEDGIAILTFYKQQERTIRNKLRIYHNGIRYFNIKSKMEIYKNYVQLIDFKKTFL